ncbi:MAG: ATP phosphoribosyltransferase regulatory subunit [Deltaproteobacteria bacterium]|nr:ATP phosphoribosyltransferase regulatory subunit [Deltaproteobacteria bacterium]
MTKPRSIPLPQGVRDILPGEAEKISAVEETIVGVFKNSKYKRIVTPLLEYVDSLSAGLGEELKKKLLKFIEPSTGKVMAIRPDITPQIARVVATKMAKADFPLRLFYNENVLRYRESGDGHSKEILQVGAEFISTEMPSDKANKVAAETEMVIMAIESLKTVGVSDFKIDLGDVGFVRSLLGRIKCSDEERFEIKKAVAIKDTPGLRKLTRELTDGAINSDDQELLIALPTLYGGTEVIETANKFKAAENKLNDLLQVVSAVTDKGYAEYIAIDLGEVRGFDYYTGIIFEGFAKGYGKAILSGGRYDKLLEKYGLSARACGFAFDIENIVAILEKNK